MTSDHQSSIHKPEPRLCCCKVDLGSKVKEMNSGGGGGGGCSNTFCPFSSSDTSLIVVCERQQVTLIGERNASFFIYTKNQVHKVLNIKFNKRLMRDLIAYKG